MSGSGTGKVLNNENRQVKILEPQVKGEILKNYNITAVIFNSPGEDSRPLPDDFFAHIEASNIGKKIAVGFLDTKNPPTVEAGEKKTYSRDSGGNIKASVLLKKDGSIEITGASEISIDGTVININSGSDFAVRFGDLQTAFNELKTAFNTHTHVYSPGPDSPTSTAPGIPQSVADISLSKVSEVKLP